MVACQLFAASIVYGYFIYLAWEKNNSGWNLAALAAGIIIGSKWLTRFLLRIKE